MQLCTNVCMYLPQAVSFPLAIGIEWDLFRRTQLVQEAELEPAESSCCVVVPLSPAATLLVNIIEETNIILVMLGRYVCNNDNLTQYFLCYCIKCPYTRYGS